MMQNLGVMTISLLAAISACGLAWYVAQAGLSLSYVTLADGRRQQRAMPLLFRVLLPFAPNFTFLFSSPRLDKTRTKIDRKLVAAGYEGVISASEILALRILLPLVAGTLLSLLLHLAFMQTPGKLGALLLEREMLIFALLYLLMLMYPGIWLKSVLKKRHGEIERALPFVLDLLTLSVESGMDFMTGIRRIIERRKIDALSEELIYMFQQIQVGKTRREGLREMARRIDHPDVNSLTNALVQADELGTSIGTALRIQADQMRVRRYQRAEKLANEAPVKMLFPLVVFIFPAVFIILLGPILAQVFAQGF
jgi:tight adherence protein C